MPYNIQQKYEKIVLQLHPEHRNAFQTIKLNCLEDTLKTKLKNVTARAKRRNMDFKVSRRVIDKATPHNIHKGGSAFCNHCVLEKYYILTGKSKNSLNWRNELINKCRHLNRFSLENFPCKPNG